jgi:hypothetical protein
MMIVVFLKLQQVIATDAPTAAYPKGGDNTLLAPPPGGHPADTQIDCDFSYRQQFIL